MGGDRRPGARCELIGPIPATEHRHQRSQPTQDLRLQERVVDCLVEQTLATLGRLGHGGGTEQERDDEPLDDLTLLESIVGTASVHEGALGSLGAQGKAPAEIVRLCD